MNPHLQDLLKRVPALECCATDIDAALALMLSAYEDGHKLLLCGNGGSAADAEHWSGELLKGFIQPRPLPPSQASQLPPELTGHLQWALPAIPLNGFLSLSSAYSNDVHGDMVLAQLTWGLGQSGDVLVGISTSGDSRNVCLAAQAAQAKGLKVLGLTGQNGGKLASLADVCIRVPASKTYLIQEYHLPVYHALSIMLEDAWSDRLARQASGRE